MRVLHILNDIREIGNGIVNVAIDLACLQAKDRHEVAVVSAGGEYEQLLADYGVKHFQLNQSRNPPNLIAAALRYQAIVKKFQPDVVHAHMMTGVLIAWAFKKSAKYCLVSTVHNEFQRSALLMGVADRVIAVSQAVANSMVRRGILKQKLRVVLNGVVGSPRSRAIKDYQPLVLHRPAIATVAGMYQRKGISELIDAFVEIAPYFPQAHLYLVGDGPDRPIFEAKVQSTIYRERIHFEGFQAQPQRYMLATDIFTLVSHSEPFGLVLTEARQAGCAIIASDVDGIPEALDNGQAGILVPSKDSRLLAEAMEKLLSDDELLQKWKDKAQQNLERFSAARFNQETLAVYRELTAKYRA